MRTWCWRLQGSTISPRSLQTKVSEVYNALSSLQYNSISCITYRAKQLTEHTFISRQFNKQVFCFLFFQASEEKENKIKVLHIKEAGPVQFTPLDAEQRQATCELVNLKNRKPGQELKYVNVGRVCDNIHPPTPKHIQRIQGNGNCLFKGLVLCNNGYADRAQGPLPIYM